MGEVRALGLSWVFGLSANVSGGVLNLSDHTASRVCYAAAHTAVIYDTASHQQTLLQGHRSAITCLCANSSRTVVVTADSGSDSLIILWDTRTASPVRSYSQPHPHGTCALDLAPDGSQLATLSCPEPDTGEQEIALWDLSSAADSPAVRCPIPSGDAQHCIRFNTDTPAELLTNGRQRVYFWGSQLPGAAIFKFYSPPLYASDFPQPLGDFTMSTFVPRTTQAVSATVDGDLLLWDQPASPTEVGMRATDRRTAKVVRLHSSAIRWLSAQGSYLVTGGADGFIRFFDARLRLSAWFEDLNAGGIESVAFAAASVEGGAGGAPDLDRFEAPDFVVSTAAGKLVAVRAAAFEAPPGVSRAGELVMEGLVPHAAALAAHPARPEVLLVAPGGAAQRWDLATRHLRAAHQLPQGIVSLCYSRDGALLVAGTGAGQLLLLSDSSLEAIAEFRHTKRALLRVACASNGRSVAAACAAGSVMLAVQAAAREGGGAPWRWEYVGRHVAHRAKVTGLAFGESPSGATKLFSLGEDGYLVEYDLEASSSQAGLRLAARVAITPPGTAPTAFSFAPPLPYYMQGSADTLLMVADDAYKIRLFNADTGSACATVQGPALSLPIQQLLTFKCAMTGKPYVAYSTGQRVAGLLAWPLSGDPRAGLGLIAAPEALDALALSADSRHLVSASLQDGILNLWQICTPALEAAMAESIDKTSQWASLLGPDVMAKIRDFFCYAQLRAQGEDSTEVRGRGGALALGCLGDLLRALGHYPSQAELGAMAAELRYRAALASRPEPDSMALEDFLGLYVNYRPAAGLAPEALAAAFRELGADPATGMLSREALVEALTGAGEAMSHEELAVCLAALTGAAGPGLPLAPQLTADQFATGVLGFDLEQVSSRPASQGVAA